MKDDEKKRKKEERAIAITNRIRALCAENGITVAELCRRAGIPQTTFSNWANRHSMPSIEAMEKMAKVLGVPVKYITDGVIATATVYDKVDSFISFSALEDRMSELPLDKQEQLLESFMQIVELVE